MAPSVDRSLDFAGAQHASPLARTALVVYLALLIYGSLSPWQDWRDLGVSPLAFLSAPAPTHVTGFDLALNVLAYLPLGALVAFAVYPRLRGAAALAAGSVGGIAFSLLLESLQSYLPARIPSNLDLATNAAGAVLGALAGTVMAPALLGRRELQRARDRWFFPDCAAVLLLAALWPLAQLHPGATLFGNGEIDRGWVAAVLAALGAAPSAFDAQQFVAFEVLITTAGMLGAGLALACSMRPQAPRLRLLYVLVVAALAAKALAYGHQFGPQRAFAWLTPGAVGGLLVGSLVLAAAAAGTARATRALALLALLSLVVAVNAISANPYHEQWLAQWRHGRLRDLAALAQWVAQAWPFVLLVLLARQALHRGPYNRAEELDSR